MIQPIDRATFQRRGSTTNPFAPLGRRTGRRVNQDGTEVKLGVFLSNTKSRRANLATDKLAALADLGMLW